MPEQYTITKTITLPEAVGYAAIALGFKRAIAKILWFEWKNDRKHN
jgi:hypothetical protein